MILDAGEHPKSRARRALEAPGARLLGRRGPGVRWCIGRFPSRLLPTLVVALALAAIGCSSGIGRDDAGAPAGGTDPAAEAGGAGSDGEVESRQPGAGTDAPDAGDDDPGAGDDDPGPGDDDPGGDDTTPGDLLPEEEVASRVAALGGQLAIGNGPEVVVARPDGLGRRLLDGSPSVVAAQPTWSGDGSRLAWSSVSAERQSVVIQSFGANGETEGEPAVSDAAGRSVFYLQWSSDDGRLAYLRNAPAGPVVEVGTLVPGSPVVPRDIGAPYFISWSPTADRILAHVGEASLDLFDSARGVTGFDQLLADGGGFSAPAWVDGRTALVVLDGSLTLLDVESGEREAVAEVDVPVRFVLSPDRRHVAYQRLVAAGGVTVVGLPGPSSVTSSSVSSSSAPSSPAPSSSASLAVDPGALIVLDLTTGEQVEVTDRRSLAWEWSPDGDRLAWLELTDPSTRPTARWHFWSRTATARSTRSPDFAISRKEGQAYLPFFAQYTQSVTRWSPDSTAFAFAGGLGGRQGVWIQLVDEPAAPLRVAPGDFVTWGDGPTPPPSGSRASAA